MNRALTYIVIVSASVFAGSKYFQSATASANSLHVPASDVYAIDGDTVAIGDDRYRLMGFDTPETRFAQCDAERAKGNEATERLRQIISGSPEVTLHVEPNRDKYDRYLARLEVNGRDVGPTLIAEGLARAYSGGQRQGWCS